MAQTTVSDFVIWVKHIDGDPAVVERIVSMNPGETVRLKVDGVLGAWRKMDNGRDGRPTRGIRPIGRTQQFWRELYKEHRGEVVTVELSHEQAHPAETASPLPIYPPLASSEAEREAAREALLESARQGWRSDGPYGSRDELYDR